MYLINRLENLGKNLLKQDCAKKVLSSMCKDWQSKVTSMKDSCYFKTLDITTLFAKLTKHKHELKILEASKSNANKKEKARKEKRIISLKASTSKPKVKESDGSVDYDDSSKK